MVTVPPYPRRKPAHQGSTAPRPMEHPPRRSSKRTFFASVMEPRQKVTERPAAAARIGVILAQNERQTERSPLHFAFLNSREVSCTRASGRGLFRPALLTRHLPPQSPRESLIDVLSAPDCRRSAQRHCDASIAPPRVADQKARSTARSSKGEQRPSMRVHHYREPDINSCSRPSAIAHRLLE